MIDILCPIQWAEGGNNDYRPVVISGALPSELSFLAYPEYRGQLTNVKPCPCCQRDAIPLLLNWVYQGPQVILLDNTVTYCLNTKRLLLSKVEEELLRQQWGRLSNGSLVPLTRRVVGMGDKITEPLIGPKIHQALWFKVSDGAFFSDEANAISSGLSITPEMEVLPDAVAFHSNEPPEKISLTVEATTRCNFRCEFCYGRHIEQGSLSLKDFSVILDRLPGLQSVEFTGEGEPLVNRSLTEMVRICVDKGLWTHVTSNGSFLNRTTCERLLAVGPSSIAVSLESIEPEQFARLRPGGRLETVLDAVRTIARLRSERSLPLQLRLWVTILRETVGQVERIEEFAREAGVDLVEFQVLNPMEAYSRFYGDELRRNMLGVTEMKTLIRDPATPQALRSALASVLSVYRGRRCDIFTNAAMVYWQGSVTPCRLLKTPHFSAYGNLVAESFEEVWNREEYRFFRFALQHGIVLRSCKGCPSVFSAPAMTSDNRPDDVQCGSCGG